MIPILSGKEAHDFSSCDMDEDEDLKKTVSQIIAEVKTGKDKAARQIAKRLGDDVPDKWLLNQDQIDAACCRLPESTKTIIETACARIENYARQIMDLIKSITVDNGQFITGMDFKPVNRVACYVPSGRYPLPSTALMTAVTAKVAGVKEICIFSPNCKDEIIYAATLSGVGEIYQIGGAQAIAACAFGTETIKPVDIVVGPGNAYVTEAKRQLQGKIGIDMLAGPSEIAIIADAKANPKWLALDLLSQAEHDPCARAYMITDCKELAFATAKEIEAAMKNLDLPPFINESISKSAILILPDIEECLAKANLIAPEHLQLQVANPEELKPKLLNYGALFMGYHSTVPYGDYMAGPNHTLPTGGAARFSGGLNPLVFLRAQSWIQASSQADELARQTAQFARIEGLKAHAAAAECRYVVLAAKSN